MSEAIYGEAFITHEFDEAIAIQQAIVDGAETLTTAHSRAEFEASHQDGHQGGPEVL